MTKTIEINHQGDWVEVVEIKYHTPKKNYVVNDGGFENIQDIRIVDEEEKPEEIEKLKIVNFKPFREDLKLYEITKKINELIEAVNRLQEEK